MIEIFLPLHQTPFKMQRVIFFIIKVLASVVVICCFFVFAILQFSLIYRNQERKSQPHSEELSAFEKEVLGSAHATP